jgi:cytochrome bd ubiquinol oxidase subunit I
MDSLLFYPPRDFGPVMKGLIIGSVGIFHVFLAQFAIGGGLLMSYFEWLHGKGKERDARVFLDGFFRVLVLISFVVGAVTGVGMWLTAIQISPRTIGLMVDHFHWIWAIEWTFFCVEVICGYTYYRYSTRLSQKNRFRLLLLYAGASWGSLFWINGILSWQLTPGSWLQTGNVWAGFFNPSFWPSLLFRTVAAMATGALGAAAVINTMDLPRERRHRLLRVALRFMAPMLLMPLIGIWYLAVIPPDSRQWILGGSAALNLFFAIGAGASLLLALYAIALLKFEKLYINAATALLLLALAFGATAGGEFVREGARKPFSIRHVLYSNAIRPSDVAHLRKNGATSRDPYPLLERYPNAQLEVGARTFRLQCSVCHTLDGINGILHLTGTWDTEQKRMNIAKLQHTKAYMPPFAGTPQELEGLVQFLRWHKAAKPSSWPLSKDPKVYALLSRYLREAGTKQPEWRGNSAGSRVEKPETPKP